MRIFKTRQEGNIKEGDHIKVDRGVYTHHGIYCGENTVVHYSDRYKNKTRALIGKDSLISFRGDDVVEVVPHKNSYPAYFVIKRAKSRISESEYNLFFNNCEHFATWCKTGESKSIQANMALRVATKLLIKHPLIYVVVEGVQILLDGDFFKSERPRYEFLPLDVLFLLQVFKYAYEQKNAKMLSTTISERFSSNIYGGTKNNFTHLMETNFNYLRYGLKPSLTITIHDVLTEDQHEFRAILDIDANMNALGAVDIPFTRYDSGQLLCVARPEDGEWRIVELTKLEQGEREPLAIGYAQFFRKLHKRGKGKGHQ